MQKRKLILAIDKIVAHGRDIQPAKTAANPFAPLLIGGALGGPAMADRKAARKMFLAHDCPPFASSETPMSPQS
jgi:hypothetical protein